MSHIPISTGAKIAAIFTLLLVFLSLLLPRTQIFIALDAKEQSYQLYYYSEGYQEGNSSVVKHPTFLQSNLGLQKGALFPLKDSQRFRFDINGKNAFSVDAITTIERSLISTTYRHYGTSSLGTLNDLIYDGRLFNVTGSDPYIEIALDGAETHTVSHLNWDWMFLSLFALLAVTAIQGYRRLIDPAITAPLLAFTVTLALSFALSLSLRFDHGPDEAMHFGSFFWYTEHLRPPSIAWNDDVYLHPLWQSNYILGASADLTYLMTARLAVLLGWILPSFEPLYLLRLSQLTMVAAGAGLCARYAGVSFATAYMLAWAVIPQLTYTATYLNGDVLSFVIAFVSCALILNQSRTSLIPLLIAIFLLLNLKTNYQILIAILGAGWLLHAFRERAVCWRTVIIVCAAIPLMLYRRLFNYWDEHAAGQSYVQVAHQRVLSNASASSETHNLPVEYVQTVYERILQGPSQFEWHTLWNTDWYVSSAWSFFGVFGYMDFAVPVAYLVLSIAAFFYVVKLASTTAAHRWMLASCAMLVLFASLYYSVSQGYQAQGRYLFPFACLAFALASRGIQKNAALLAFSVVSTIVALTQFR